MNVSKSTNSKWNYSRLTIQEQVNEDNCRTYRNCFNTSTQQKLPLRNSIVHTVNHETNSTKQFLQSPANPGTDGSAPTGQNRDCEKQCALNTWASSFKSLTFDPSFVWKWTKKLPTSGPLPVISHQGGSSATGPTLCSPWSAPANPRSATVCNRFYLRA